MEQQAECIEPTEPPKKSNAISSLGYIPWKSITLAMGVQFSANNLSVLTRHLSSHGYVAYALEDTEHRLAKVKANPADEDGPKLKLDYHFSDVDFLEPGVDLFVNSVPQEPGRYSYVLTADGELTIGRVYNNLEYGVKHHQMARGRKVYGAGELLVTPDPRTVGKLLYEINQQSGTFAKPIASYVKTGNEAGPKIINPELYLHDMHRALREILHIYASSAGRVELTHRRLLDDVGPPTLEYVRKLCENEVFRGRASVVKAKEGMMRNKDFCDHIKTLEDGTDITDLKFFFGLDKLPKANPTAPVALGRH